MTGKQRWSKERAPRRSPWILLWLLPYLFFSIGDSALHNHPLIQEAGTHYTLQRYTGHTTKASYNKSSGSALATDTDCFACQWTAQSSADFNLPALATSVTQIAVRALPAAVFATLHSSLTQASRGPPLS